MIRRLYLTQWRSYDHLDIALEPGTTFVVAPNGVGKSSLVMAMAWGVYGDYSAIDARECIRGNATEASVGVELELPSGRHVTIERTVRLKGKGRFTASVDGESLAADALSQLYEDEFSVAPAVAARLALMAGRGDPAAPSTLNLEDHLYRAFGVDNLVVNAQTARQAATRAARVRKETRASDRQRLADREQTGIELASAENDAAAARRSAAEAKAALNECANELETARRLAAHEAEVKHREALVQDLLAAVRATLDEDAETGLDSPERVQERIVGQLAELEVQDARTSEDERSSQVAKAAAELALNLLATPTPTCPTCLRPLDGHELEHAIAQQRALRDEAEDELRSISVRLSTTRERMARLRELVDQLERLAPPQPPTIAGAPRQVDELEDQHARLLEQLEQANQHLGDAEARMARLQKSLDDDDHAAQQNEVLVQAFRDEALAEAAATAIEAARDRAVEALIEPIAHEVRSRWKRLFDDDGLVLKPDGSMIRLIAGRELSWASLSGGEQAWARIIAHLLIVGSSTTLPFVWFDEPLEHLDPRLRATAAATLAGATQHGGPRQLIVTTYEDALAEQLAAGRRDAHLVRVRPAAALAATTDGWQ